MDLILCRRENCEPNARRSECTTKYRRRKKNTQSIHRFQFYIVPVNPTLFLCVSLALALVLSRIRRGAHTSMRRAQWFGAFFVGDFSFLSSDWDFGFDNNLANMQYVCSVLRNDNEPRENKLNSKYWNLLVCCTHPFVCYRFKIQVFIFVLFAFRWRSLFLFFLFECLGYSWPLLAFNEPSHTQSIFKVNIWRAHCMQ